MDRALREFRIRGVSTNIAFVENLLKHPTFLSDHTQRNLLTKRPICFRLKNAATAGPRF